MPSITVDTSTAENANEPAQDMHADSPAPSGNDYLDYTLQKEIALWFEKDNPSENNPSINEPTNAAIVEGPPDVINLGYNNE